MKVEVSKLLQVKPVEFFKLDGSLDVILSHGSVVRMTPLELAINGSIWELNKRFNNGIVNENHVISAHFKNGLFSNSVFGDTLSAIYKDIVMTKITTGNGFSKVDLDDVSRVVIKILNYVYNKVSWKSMKHVCGFNIFDLVDVGTDINVLKKTLALTKDPTAHTVQIVRNEVDSLLKENWSSRLGMAYVTGYIKKEQLLQMLACVGGVTNAKGIPYKNIVTESFLFGLTHEPFTVMNSLMGIKAFIQSVDALQQSEYSARGTQNLTAVMSTVEFTDCGSTDYVDWHVAEASADRDSALLTMEGMFYLDEKTGTEKHITKKDTHLIGKNIKLRMVETCKLSTKHTCCIKCFGLLGLSMQHNVNIGVLGSTVKSEQSTQGALSFKHVIASAFGEVDTYVSPEASKYLVGKDDGMGFKPASKKISYELIIPVKSAKWLSYSKSQVQSIDGKSATRLRRIGVLQTVDGVTTREYFHVDHDGRSGYFSDTFMQYCMENKRLQGENFYIDMTGWNYTTSFIHLEVLEHNMLTFVKEERNMMETKQFSNREPLNHRQLLAKYEAHTNRKLTVPLSYLQLHTASLVVHEKTGKLVRASDVGAVMDGIRLLERRSLSAAYSYDDFMAKHLSPLGFYNGPDTNTSHPADVHFDTKHLRKVHVDGIEGTFNTKNI